MVDQRDLQQWISKECAIDADEDGDSGRGIIVRLVLRHASDMMTVTEEPVKRFTDAKAASLADRILAAAVRNHEARGGISGPPIYHVLAFIAGAVKPRAHFIMNLTPEGEELVPTADGGQLPARLSPEVAVLRALVAQQFAHNQMLFESVMSHAGENAKALQRQVNGLLDQVDKSHKVRFEQAQELERLQSMRHERDLEIRKQKFREELKADTFEEFKKLIPFVANRLAGRKILPEAYDPTVEMIRRMIRNLSKAEIEGVMLAIQSPGARASFIELYQFYLQEQEMKDKIAANNAAENGTEIEVITPGNGHNGSNGAAH